MNRRDDPDTAPEYDFSNATRGRYAGRFYVDPATPAGTVVVLRRPVAEHRLQEGDVGRVVSASESALRVEFSFGSGGTSVLVDLKPGDLRLPGDSEVLHVRETRAR